MLHKATAEKLPQSQFPRVAHCSLATDRHQVRAFEVSIVTASLTLSYCISIFKTLQNCSTSKRKFSSLAGVPSNLSGRSSFSLESAMVVPMPDYITCVIDGPPVTVACHRHTALINRA